MAKTAIKGIGAFLLSVVFVLGALWWYPASAGAVELPPGPVDPATLLPSQVARAISTGSPLGDQYLGVAAVLKQALNARAAGAVATPAAEAVPITGLGSLSRGASGSLLTGAFMLGWTITDGTMALYGATTGDEPMAASCSVMPSWTHPALKVFYPFSMPDCQGTVTAANADVTAGTSLVYAGVSVQRLGAYTYASNGTRYGVWTGTAPNLTSTAYRYQTNGSTGWTSGSPTLATMSSCSECVGPFPGGTNVVLEGRTSQGYGTGAIRIVRASDGVVLAASRTLSSNPNRTLDCKLTWPGGSTTTGSGGTYTETGGLPLHSIETACQEAFVSKPGAGPDLLPTEVGIGSTNDETGSRTEIATQDVPDFTESERKGLTPGTNGGLVLQKVSGVTVSSCMTWAADCSGWWAASDEGTSTTSPYRCLYNGAAVDLVECGIYRYTFDTQTQTPTITDPATGEEVEWSAKPSTGNSLDPGVGPGAGGSPADQCFATGWSDVANPVDWVLVPVKCALVWAFVPRTTVVTQVQTSVTTAWDDTFVGQVAAEIPPILSAVPVGDGCSGPHVAFDLSWPMEMHFSAYPLSACEPPASYLATMAKLIASFLVIGYTIWGVSRRLSAVVNAPGLGPGH